MKLRTKFLILMCGLFLAFAAVIWIFSQHLSTQINEKWGTNFAEKQVFFDKYRTLLPLRREIFLARELSTEPALIDLALHEDNTGTRQKALEVLERYRLKFQDRSYFAAPLKTGHYYFNDADNRFQDKPIRYTLSPQNPNDQWFYSTIKSRQDYQVNVDPDVHLGKTKVWINVAIKRNGEVLGLIGTGLDITQFLKESVDAEQPGTRSMFIDRNLAVQLYHDPKIIDDASITKSANKRIKVEALLLDPKDVEHLRAILPQLEKTPEKIQTLWVTFEGSRHLLGVAYLPEIGWFDLTLMDDQTLSIFKDLNIAPLLALMFFIALSVVAFMLNRLVLKPIHTIGESVRQVQLGQYDTDPLLVGTGEIAQLSMQFRAMVKVVRNNKRDLEDKVARRTAELSQELMVRQQAEDKLSRSEMMLRTLYDTTSDAVMLLTERGFFDCNPATLELFGCSSENEFCTKHPADLSPPLQPCGTNSMELANRHIATAMEKGSNHFEWVHQRLDNGLAFPADVLLNAMKINDKLVLQAVVRDITQRKQTETKLQLAKDAAESLAQSKSEFLANMSHEIRTPMNAIIGLSHLALNKQVSADVRDYLEKINASSESLLGILNDILDFSKMEAGKLSIENSRFSLELLINNLRNLFSVYAEKMHLEFAIETDPLIPDELVGDALRIQQILSNLLGNAIKFTARGKVTLALKRLELNNSMASINFSVSDTGIGISKEDQAKLFQPFSQADTSITRRFGGTGLGLVISHKLLQLMGSDFHLESRPGRGSTFDFDLTLGVSAVPMEQTNNRQGAARRAGTLSHGLHERGRLLSGARILVAEDNLINQQVVKEFLQLSGVSVDIANNGVEALQLMAKNVYDAVLMDVHMPEMGGVEATELIRKQAQFSGLPVLALSAGVTQEEKEKCLTCGMNDFIAKPINPEELIGVLCHWIGRNRALESTPGLIAEAPDVDHDSSLDHLSGFDLTNLLSMVAGNKDFVTRLLCTFRDEYANFDAELQPYLDDKDYQAAKIRIHAIKGAASNIGAIMLSAAAASMESALQQGRLDQEAHANFHQALQDALAELGKLEILHGE